jgi:Sulfotransferase family
VTNPFLFIVGCPRSGTTLLRRMVDAHPRIAIASEIGWIADRYEQRGGITPDGFVKPELLAWLAERGFGRYSPLPVSAEELEDLQRQEPLPAYADFVGWLFDRYGEKWDKDLVGNKTVDYVRRIPTLHALWPRAKFVHLIRDGRDVCLSVLGWRRAAKLAQRFATWESDPVATASLWWEWHVRLGREAGAELDSDLYYELRYEALVADPEAECRALCTFLGVAYDDAMPNFYEGQTKADGSLDAKHGWLPATPGLRDWGTQMPPPDLEAFEAVAGDLLAELGYARGSAGPTAELLERTEVLRERFEGRPLPRSWQVTRV